jgi:hypothetical protein
MVLIRMGRVAIEKVACNLEVGGVKISTPNFLTRGGWVYLSTRSNKWRNLNVSLVTDDLSSSGRAILDLIYGKDTFRSIQVVSIDVADC